nr:MAG TPA: hypothetical protein [Caudoviricetes sp.]
MWRGYSVRQGRGSKNAGQGPHLDLRSRDSATPGRW